jgi:hypothetical protein
MDYHNIANTFGKSFDTIEHHLQTALASAADPGAVILLERLLESGDRSFCRHQKSA